MADIHFSCPECSGLLVVDEAGTGRELPCPHCGEVIHIPESSTMSPPGDDHDEHLHLKKSASSVWEEHLEESDDFSNRDFRATMGLEIVDSPVEGEDSSSLDGNRIEQHSPDVNTDQPWQKKKDQWFTGDGKKYHYCYYNPQSQMMLTACAKFQMPVEADTAPEDLSKLRKRAFCKECSAVLKG